jgi:hypothetical protein
MAVFERGSSVAEADAMTTSPLFMSLFSKPSHARKNRTAQTLATPDLQKELIMKFKLFHFFVDCADPNWPQLSIKNLGGGSDRSRCADFVCGEIFSSNIGLPFNPLNSTTSIEIYL